MKFFRYIDLVLQDSSSEYTNFYSVLCTTSYVDGDHLRIDVRFKYVGQDSMATIPNYVAYDDAAASTLDSATVYGAVVDAAADHDTLHLDGAVGAGYAYVFYTYDSTISQSVPRMDLLVRPEDQSNLSGDGTTDESGYATIPLGLGNYIVLEEEAGYTQDNGIDSFEVSGADTFTVYVDQWDPGSPVDTMYCLVDGYLGEIRNVLTERVKNVKVCFTPGGYGRDTCNSVGVVPEEVCTRTDTLGYFSQQLLWSVCHLSNSDDSLQYEISIEGSDMKHKIWVPATSSYRVTWE
jgi:hypothetical protein